MLTRIGGDRLRVVEADGEPLDEPGTVEVYPVGEGFAPGGASC